MHERTKAECLPLSHMQGGAELAVKQLTLSGTYCMHWADASSICMLSISLLL